MSDLPSGTVTLLFTDIEGSKKLAVRPGIEKVKMALEKLT